MSDYFTFDYFAFDFFFFFFLLNVTWQFDLLCLMKVELLDHFVLYLLQLDVVLTICLLSINHCTGYVTLIAVKKNLKEQLCFRETLKKYLAVEQVNRSDT